MESFYFCELLVHVSVRKGIIMANNRVHRLTVLAIMIALDFLLTPLFRIEGMAFMSSVMNIIAATFMSLFML